MSDTPRTDAVVIRNRQISLADYEALVEYGKQLDRELKQIRREIAKINAENEVLREQNFSMNKTIAKWMLDN